MNAEGGSAQGRLGAIGAGCARRPRRVIALWVAALALSVLASQLAGGIFDDNVSLSGTQAYTGLKLLEANDPEVGGYTGQVVFHLAGGDLRDRQTAVAQSVSNLGGLPHVLSVSDPLAKGSSAISKDGSTAYSTIHLDVRPKTLGESYVSRLERATAPAREAGVEVAYGGGLDELFRPSPNDALSEVIGLAVAVAVLLIGFGSVAGAGVPLLSALVAVGTGVSLLGLGASLLTFGTTAPTIAVMIGLGVGIDYALFLSTRFRQLIADGWDAVPAAARTVATSGRAVFIAACTVALALLGLYASGISFIGQLGLAAIFTVITAALASVTLVPALLGLLGRRIDSLSVRTPVAESAGESDGWHRYAERVSRHPWRFLLAGTAVLLVLALPLLSIELGHIDDGADPHSYTDRRAYDLIAAAFGPGANGTFTVVVDMDHATADAQAVAGKVQDALASTGDIAHATPLTASRNGKVLYGSVVPASKPQSQATRSLFDQLVDSTLPDALQGTGAHGYVAGGTATQIQFRDTLTARLPLVIGVVVAMAFLLLMASFRSVLVALKAAILNLLSIGAAYGVLVAVFQWGWARGLVGVSEKVPIESYVPVLMFAIVFGLSMDYEVFLLSRIRESWLRTGENTPAVAAGLSSTARVISCAALIMASVFISFVLSTSVTVKMLAVGLSISVLVDATVVRLVMVPATMTLLGEANWWLPRWLDRLLPRLEPEPDEEPAAEPAAERVG